jgi:hypothetical protein
MSHNFHGGAKVPKYYENAGAMRGPHGDSDN